MKEFGKRVRTQRQAMGLTREEFCGDETELSVRQLARIEAGTSLPNLDKIYFISKRLQTSISAITEGESFDIPQRYKELKYLLLRIPTYLDEQRIRDKESWFDEIYVDYYETLPEEEQLIIDCLQSKLDIGISNNLDFASGILEEYFRQVLKRKKYKINDLVFIDLYMSCINTQGFMDTFIDNIDMNEFINKILLQIKYLPKEDLFVLNNVLISSFTLLYSLEKFDLIEKVLELAYHILQTTQDFQKMPIINLLDWKFNLYCKKDKKSAEILYQKAIVFVDLTGDVYLKNKINQEWELDSKTE